MKFIKKYFSTPIKNKKENKQPIICKLAFLVDKDGQISSACAWNKGKVEEFAQLLFKVNNGECLQFILKALKESSTNSDEIDDYNFIANFIVEQSFEEIEEEPVIKPSQAFFRKEMGD